LPTRPGKTAVRRGMAPRRTGGKRFSRRAGRPFGGMSRQPGEAGRRWDATSFPASAPMPHPAVRGIPVAEERFGLGRAKEAMRLGQASSEAGRGDAGGFRERPSRCPAPSGEAFEGAGPVTGGERTVFSGEGQRAAPTLAKARDVKRQGGVRTALCVRDRLPAAGPLKSRAGRLRGRGAMRRTGGAKR